MSSLQSVPHTGTHVAMPSLTFSLPCLPLDLPDSRMSPIIFHSPAAAEGLTTASRHILSNLLHVPAANLRFASDFFGVEVNGVAYKGMLPWARAVREVAGEAHAAFVGADRVSVSNQWLSIASCLFFDQIESANNHFPSQVTKLCSTIAFMLDDREVHTSAFLAQGATPGVEDVMLFAALASHPNTTGLPAIQKWRSAVAKHEVIAPISPVAPAAKKQESAKQEDATKKGGKPVYVKPDEAAIAQRRLEKARQKAEKEALKAANPQASSSTQKKAEEQLPGLPIEEMDIRVGRLENLRVHPDADRLYVESMNIGSEVRTIVSGLVPHYAIDDLNNQLCLVICNMKAKPLKGIVSHGMVLCGSTESKVRLVKPPAGAQPGDRVMFGPAYQTPSYTPPATLSGNKVTELLASMRLNGQGELCWKEVHAHLEQGIPSVADMADCLVK